MYFLFLSKLDQSINDINSNLMTPWSKISILCASIIEEVCVFIAYQSASAFFIILYKHISPKSFGCVYFLEMVSAYLTETDFKDVFVCYFKSFIFPLQEVTAQEALDVEYQDIARMGVIQVAGDDRLGRKVVVFSACRLPDYDKVDYQRLYE